jgi:uncharacterized lipoprotein YddW (UPF0748 family)
VTRWDYTVPADVEYIIERAAWARFNIILFQVRGAGDAFYASQVEPWAQRLTGSLGQDPGWDPLSLAVELAHSRDLELHAYINVYPAWTGVAPPPAVSPEPMYLTLSRLYGQDWVQWHEDGTPMPLSPGYLWASPGSWAVQDHMVTVARDILSRYDVDGLHLDNVRYAGPAYSHDPFSTLRFGRDSVLDPTLTWEEWQRDRVTELVGRLHSDLGSLRPASSLSAAVWPVYRDVWDWWISADGYDGYYQDSVGWLQSGQVDAIYPMLYGSTLLHHLDRFEVLLSDFVARAGERPVHAGISAGYDDFSAMAERIDAARALGAEGQGIFSGRLVDQHGYWDEFRLGPYAQPASPP